MQSKSPSATKKIAAALAKKQQQKAVICLYGDLGSGKTTFVKGFAAELGLKENQIKSPTYTLVRSYKLADSPKMAAQKLHHFDFYRITEPDDLLAADLHEIFSEKNALILIEWPERIKKFLPAKKINIYFEYIDEKTRSIKIHNKHS